MASDRVIQLIREAVRRRLCMGIEEGRIYRPSGPVSDLQISTEYTLTPEEQAAYRQMSRTDRMAFARMKIKQARKERGICFFCGENPAIKKKDGSTGTYCQGCLDTLKEKRKKLAQHRNSCVRCPNPREPGKKLCTKCRKELEASRDKAKEQGLCIRCKKVPAEPNEQGEMTQYCRKCMKIKVAQNKVRRQLVRGWKKYGKDVLDAIKQQKRKPTDAGSGWVK